uniref:WAP domain-containing protein n=1 Tax=Magallana gigas TaxID=29159 RepID=A0A8W8P3R2_MAGGI
MERTLYCAVCLLGLFIVVFSQQCDNGEPLPNVFCGRESSQACPSSYFCNMDPTDRFAVCCPLSERPRFYGKYMYPRRSKY